MTDELEQYYSDQNKVVELYAKGFRVRDIQNKTGLSRNRIDELLDSFRDYAKQDKVIRERAREIVLVVDTHYSEIIKDMHAAVDEANQNGDYKVVVSGLKMIADAEARRVDLLQKSGILAGNELADKQAELENRQEIIFKIFEDLCYNCKIMVQNRLKNISTEIKPVIEHS